MNSTDGLLEVTIIGGNEGNIDKLLSLLSITLKEVDANKSKLGQEVHICCEVKDDAGSYEVTLDAKSLANSMKDHFNIQVDISDSPTSISNQLGIDHIISASDDAVNSNNPEYRYAVMAKRALEHHRNGMDAGLIELPEKAVFPYLIQAAPTTARKSRNTGELLGASTPRYIKRGRSVRYTLKDVLEWIAAREESFRSTSDESARKLRDGML